MEDPSAPVLLTIMATSDLHAHLRPYNYYTDQEEPGKGLAALGGLIRKLRSERLNCLLFDNGDTLQGTPMGDVAATQSDARAQPHPMIAAMNILGYDAATLGNHDFNYGLHFLEHSLAEAQFPVVLANLTRADGSRFKPPSALLTRSLTDANGAQCDINIGVIGLAPPQITKWDQRVLAGAVRTSGIVEEARAAARDLRAQGADLIVALCHSGAGAAEDHPDLENALIPLTESGLADAIIAGHTHRLIPAPNTVSDPPFAVPVVQPGFHGTHLGVLDLTLYRAAGGWHISAAEARTVPAPQIDPDPEVMQSSLAAHRATLSVTSQPIGRSDKPLHSYFSLLEPDDGLRLIARAQSHAAQQLLAQHPLRDLPILSAVAPFKSGGRAGPDSYCDIVAGPLTLRNLADLYPFPNTLQILRATGAHIIEWLERAACAFHHIKPGQSNAMLLNREFSCYNFDAIFGLTYQIDLSAQPLYSADGEIRHSGPGRIRNLQYRGQPVTNDQAFLVAANSYRAAGGGHFPAAAACPIVIDSHQTVRDVLIRTMPALNSNPSTWEPPWSFVPLGGTQLYFGTGPGAAAHKIDIDRLGLTQCSTREPGYIGFNLLL